MNEINIVYCRGNILQKFKRCNNTINFSQYHRYHQQRTKTNVHKFSWNEMFSVTLTSGVTENWIIRCFNRQLSFKARILLYQTNQLKSIIGMTFYTHTIHRMKQFR